MKTTCDKNEAERRPPGAKKISDGVHRMRPPSWLTPSRAKSVVCAVEGRAYSPWLDYLFLAPPFLAPPFLAPPFLAPPFFAPPFAAFLVAISCSCSFSFFGVPPRSWSRNRPRRRELPRSTPSRVCRCRAGFVARRARAPGLSSRRGGDRSRTR